MHYTAPRVQQSRGFSMRVFRRRIEMLPTYFITCKAEDIARDPNWKIKTRCMHHDRFTGRERIPRGHL